MKKRRLDLTNKKFGLLTIKQVAYVKKQKTYWLCDCECGGSIIKRYDLISDSPMPNCGCKTKDLQAQNCLEHVAGKYKFWLGKRGKKHPSWKKNKSHQALRSTEDYKEWRLNVFKRDGFRCQVCDKVGKELNAHHIMSFAKFKKLRFNIDNGITLCKECHVKLHSKNGDEKL